MVVVADASVAIRADLDQFKSDIAGAKTQAVTLGAELRKALSFGPLAAQGPDALVAGLDRARAEADDVTASIHKLIAAGKLPAEDARRYADILDEIGIEADQTTSELKQLRAADPRFDTPAIKAAADQIDRVGDEAKGTAAELNAMKGVRADTQLQSLAQQAKEGAKGLDATGKSAGGLIGKLNSVKGALVGLGVFIGAQQIVAGLRNFFGDAIESATKLQTATRGVETVLGDSADTVQAFGTTSAESFGLSKRAVAEFGAVIGAQLKAAGFELAEAATETVKLQQRAADLAATFGGPVDDAVTAIGALLRGERDTIEKYGVSIKQVDVDARIAALGLNTSTAAALKNATAVASLSLFYEQTSGSMDAFSKNADTNAVIQAKAAAKMENAMGKLGDALLPLVAGITDFTADVLPPLIDGMLTVGGIFGEHGDIIIPAVVLAMTTRLIPTVLAAAAAYDALAVSARLAQAAMFGLPAILFAAERATHDFAEEASELKLPDQSIFSLWVDDLTTTLNGGLTVTEDWVNNMGGTLAGGADTVAAGAEEGIAGPLAAAVRAAHDQAVTDARALPGDIAAAIIEGRDLVLAAATGLASAATDPLLQEARITEIRAQLTDLANAPAQAMEDANQRVTEAGLALIAAQERTANGMTAAEKAGLVRAQNNYAEAVEARKKLNGQLTADDELKYAQLEIQLAGYLLRADPKSKEAMQLLAKYAKSEEPATKAAYDALMTAVEDRATILANDLEAEAERAGISVEEALNRHRKATVDAALVMANGVRMALLFDAVAGGIGIGEDWINGILHGIANKQTSLWLATGKVKNLLGGSLPTEGPLQHPETGGYSIGEAWAKAIVPGIYSGLGDINHALAGWAQGLSLGSAVLPIAAMPGPSAGSGGSPAVGGNVTNINLAIEGEKPVISTAAEIAEQAARLGRFRG